MMKSRMAIAVLIIAGLASPTIGASAKTHKHSGKQQSTMKKEEPNAKPGVTTGANMKSKSPATANPSSGDNGSTGTTSTKKGY